MRRSRTALVVAAAALAVVAVLLVGRRDPLRPRTPRFALAEPASAPIHYALQRDDEHVKQVETKMAPIAARFRAEQGATPCETAFNGFRAFVDADPDRHNTTFALPPREEFLRRCAALDEQEQLCLGAAYEAAHRGVCQPLYRAMSAKVFDPAPN